MEDGVLSVSALTLSDAGMYQCVAENKHGVIYFAAELMVLGRWHLSPKSQITVTQKNLKVISLSFLKVVWISG